MVPKGELQLFYLLFFTDDTELGYLSGVTSSIQSQLSARVGTGTAFSGDVSGAYNATSVDKIKGTAVSATTPTTSGQVLRFNGTSWVPNFVAMTDIRSTVTGTTAFASSGCAANETLSWNSVGDILTCQSIGSLPGSAISSGTVAAARLGSGTTDATTYLRGDNTWVTAPADATKLPLAGGTMTGAILLPAGAVGTPSLSFSGDTNTGIYSSAADTLHLVTNGTDRVKFDSSGNISFGTTTMYSAGSGGPYYFSKSVDDGAQLSISNPNTGTSSLAAFTAFGGAGFPGYFGVGHSAHSVASWANRAFVTSSAGLSGVTIETQGAGDDIRLYTGAQAERMRIDGNGNVGIGTTSPNNKLEVSAADASVAAAVINTDSSVARYPQSKVGNYMGTAASGYPSFTVTNSRGTFASPTVIQSGDWLGTFSGYGSSDTSWNTKLGGYMGFEAAQNFSSTASGTHLFFSTTPNGTTSPTEKMRITESGNVGIGTPSPTERLHVYKNANSALALKLENASGSGDQADTYVELKTRSSDFKLHVNDDTNNFAIVDSNAGTIRMVVDGSGNTAFGANLSWPTLSNSAFYMNSSNNIGMGTISPTSTLHIKKTGGAGGGAEILNLEAEGETSLRIRSADNSGITNYLNPIISTFKSRGTLASQAAVQSGDTVFEMNINGHDGTTDRPLAYITAVVDGTTGSNDMPGRLEFHTQADGGGSSLEGTTPEMVIKNTGYVGISNSSPASLLHVGSSSTSAGTAVAKFQTNTGTCTMTPATSGTGMACSSDERLKRDIASVSGDFALEKIVQMQAKTYQFKKDSSGKRYTGYIAQELQKIAPEFVRQDDDGYLQIYYDGLIPWITEAIKTLYHKISGVEKEVQTLKLENAQLKAQAEKEKTKKDEEIAELKNRLEKLESLIKSK